MKHFFIGVVLVLGLGFGSVKADVAPKRTASLETEISTLKAKQESLGKEVNGLSSRCGRAETQISEAQSACMKLNGRIDSLQKRCNAIDADHKADKSELMGSIGKTNEQVQAAGEAISSRTLLGICGLCLLLAAIIAIAYFFSKKFKVGYTSIGEVRKAQEALQSAQAKMQEESLKLDDKLLELLNRQIESTPKVPVNDKPDHSLALKVADEVARIETNLSHMDSSIRGYKQLSKAVQRIKDNFKAKDYEIVDMLGKPYNEGMKVIANFIINEDLEEGKQIITGLTKPQVNYNGQMIQAAQITVSQNI